MTLPARAPRGEANIPYAEQPFTEHETRLFRAAMEALNREGVPFMLAGAFGLLHYTGMWRGTKDLDALILPQHRDRAVRAICDAGLHDMYDDEPYDREWIFRGTRDGVIVDLIWRLANKVDDIDPSWIERSTPGEFLGVPVRYVGPADLCWMKLFVFQRLRCDWPDLLNVIRGTGGKLDWDHLLREVGPHWRLLCGLVDIYDWLCPEERLFIPQSFRRKLEERLETNDDRAPECQKDLFDSRPWLTDPGAGYTAGR